MDKLKSAITTTGKQIRRSGWLAWASISVMTLACLVSTIFGFLGLGSFLFLQNIESKPQIYVFFEVGTPESEITELKAAWLQINGVSFIDYTSEDAAKEEFLQSQINVNDLAADAVRERTLPASLAIRLYSLNFADEINQTLSDVETTNTNIKDIRYSREIVENIREVFGWLRIGGGIIMALLLIVIVLFTLLTVEFRMHSRSKEIEIMQLVGGSLGYIRLPFILEGAFYGLVGAVVSNLILIGLIVLVQYQLNTGQLDYIRELLGALAWPSLDLVNGLIIFVVITFIASLLGAINSFVAIRRYIR